jgi:hypothetical protein
MKNQIRSLIFSLTALVALVALVLVFKYALPAKVEATATPRVETVQLISLSEEDIQSIDVKTASGVWTATRSNGNLTIPVLQNYPLDSTKLKSLLTSAASLEASREIGQDNLQLADYGLDQPIAQVQIFTGGGKQLQFMIGNQAPASLGTYVLMNNTVYLVDPYAVSAFLLQSTDYISLDVTEPLPYGAEVQTIDISQNGADISLSYVPEQPIPTPESSAAVESTPQATQAATTSTASNPAHYVMTSPVTADVSYKDVTLWSGSGNLTGLSASSIAALDPDAAKLTEMGFDNPTSTLSYTTTTGSQVTLRVAGCDADYCNVMRDGINIIYQVDRSDLRWLDISPETLLAMLFPGLMPADVQSMVISNGTDKNFTLAVNGKQYMNNNIPITRDEFDAVANAIITIEPYIENQACDLSLPPTLTATLSLVDGSSHTLEMVPTGSSSLYLVVDGNCRFTSSEGAAHTILSAASQANG